MRVSAPLCRTREIGGHIAVRIDELPLSVTTADFLPVDILPGKQILTPEPDMHPNLAWDPEGLRRNYRECKAPKETPGV